VAEPQHVQVLTAAGSEQEAEAISRRLVESRLAACVQVLGPIASRYWWEGRMETAREWLCVAKTERSRFDDVSEAIRSVHSYQVPEITAVPVVAGAGDYLAWISREVSAAPQDGPSG
jgi:periplasmic divalent cation tolerance protein